MSQSLLSLSSLPVPETHKSNAALKPTSETLGNDLYSFKTPFELKQIHAHIIKTNTSPSLLSLSLVASVCAFTPSFPYARKLIQISGKPENVVWNSCLKDFAESDRPIDAIRLFCRLCEIVHGFIEKLGLQSNLFLQNSMVHLYAVSGETSDALQLFDKMSQRDIVTWNIMITQLVKKGKVDDAYELFDNMPERNVRSWTSMIMGFVQCGKPKAAIDLFTQMEEQKLHPNEVTVVAVLAACADIGALDLGRRIHDFSNESGFRTNIRISNTLIDMYIKCGCLDSARSVFNEMEQRTIVSWSAMIQGLAINGNGEEALNLFQEMIHLRIKPNGVTFIGLLHACSHMGMVKEGQRFFASMTKDYGIVPRIEHYGCMVDLLSRAGLLKKAREFITNMPIKPNGVVWGAFLGGCRVHKNIEMAEEAIEHLLELDPLNDGYYVVLSNIYAEAKRWEDAARVRKLMREKGVKKTPGSSSITIDGVTHEFVAGDEAHDQNKEIHQRWEKLLQEMKLRGYVPDTSVVLLDVEESEKVRFLFRHSEKLAVVFGLINTADGTPIRIMKNLRVCEDCHEALKIISEIVDREIVVRDRSRFHCFKNGMCSCKNYW
ncbi:pentatricopeptide repeat-containing protein At5g66520-like isoform X2 [Cynara cardunculus var. scolymus]|uniref:pentatricopeptide repeat-containing protein At5g66520-like isoform X2 n=1 Tax=Cynara cardunculus var. scolymus TaxID=59895 RepID=UPI000D62873F|nr:pentatricopeptide repeat-containing protein At5g66520-like isoform X2 [Cynara cardunculus var. scolymus]